MTRRFFLGAAGSTGAAGAFALRAGRTAEGGPRRPPNILWIVTDDHRP